jgi:hypothetical protein
MQSARVVERRIGDLNAGLRALEGSRTKEATLAATDDRLPATDTAPLAVGEPGALEGEVGR